MHDEDCECVECFWSDLYWEFAGPILSRQRDEDDTDVRNRQESK